ncbi:hypothetical protein GN244_ATG01416 [Phytophthora infestans]|uniref:Uncharacterized protein n=1 Tax=Phytophthora infestans TaxID=4787 RepID=A0A833WMI9_PHYIN|nr:hypothetical protein GN244_ATG01416 [Phytophthora infestans]
MAPPAVHVLLMPEDVPGTSVTTPSYGSVVSVSGTLATVGLLAPPHGTIDVIASTVRNRRVDASEYDNGAPGEWLRKPVFGVDEDEYVSGQVIAYDGGTVSIRTPMGERPSSANDLVEIAPVLCFLFGQNAHRVTDMSPDELIEQSNQVLDRLLGTGGQRPTRAVSNLLAGITPPRMQPKPDDTLRWVNVTTGQASTVSVRHAVDFAYYIDGDQRVTPSVRGSIGTRFDDDPRHANTLSPPVNNADGRDDIELEAILNAIDEDSAVAPAQLESRVVEDAAGRPHMDLTRNGDSHAKVLAAIDDSPGLIRFYLSLCQSGASKRPAPYTDSGDSQRRRLESPSDLIDATEHRERRPKHAFNPTRTQQRVNELIAAPEYAGKDPAAVVDYMVSSRSTKCQPHPAIITRVCDFEFGARGLSLMHFKRFDFAARRSWYADGSVNLNSFAASVGIPKATKPQTLDDVSNALTVLHVFTEEFFDHHTRRLVGTAREFVEDLRSFCHWSAQDVGTLTFWFDRVFEDYRTSVDQDSRSGTDTRTRVQARLSLQDPDLPSVLYVIQSERLASLTGPASKHSKPAQPNRPDLSRRIETSRPQRKTPRDVIDALPRQGRRSVCIKYLSSGGCASKSDDRCAFPNHAHFLPDELPDVVRSHISNHLGGLRAELRQ